MKPNWKNTNILRSKVVLAALVVLVAATITVIFTGVLEVTGDMSSPSNPAATPVSVVPQPSHRVIYAATGELTRTASYTMRTDDGGTVQADGDLPLVKKSGGLVVFTGFKSGDFVYLSVQNSEGFGSVSCRIIVDGVEISNNTSYGGYKIATCQGRVP